MPHTIKDRIAAKLDHTEAGKLRDIRRRISEALPVCDDAEACGCNMEGPRNALKQIDSQLSEIETRFMPHPATSPHD